MAELINKLVETHFLKHRFMNKITAIIWALACFATLTGTVAQNAPGANQVYTLQQCVETAFKNNVDVKQADLLAESARLNYNLSKASMLPDLNANITHSAYNGRSINP